MVGEVLRRAGRAGKPELALEQVTGLKTDSLSKLWRSEIEASYDPLTRVTTYTYNASGTMTSVKNALNQTTTFTPNADGTLASVTDPLASNPAIASDTWTATATGGATGYSATGSGSINDSLTIPSGSSVTYTVVASISSSAYRIR